MNLLLFEQNELDGLSLVLAEDDRRARHITDILGLKQDDTVRVGMVHGKMGSGRIVRLGKQGIVIDVTLSELPVEDLGITLILALPRPIMLQRILKQATVLGVRKFHLIRSRRVHKSFFQASILQPLAIKNLLVQGLEQAVDTRLPEVLIHPRFKPFVEDIVPGIQSAHRLVAHPDTTQTLAGLYSAGRIGSEMVLAVGPEGGWVDYEVQCFVEQGFTTFAMGERILHVDTAVVVLLAQLQLLQSLRCPGKSGGIPDPQGQEWLS